MYLNQFYYTISDRFLQVNFDVFALVVKPEQGISMLIERYGIVIAINQYQDPNLPSLQYAEKDGLEVFTTLLHNAGFARENLVLLLGKEATYQNIKRAFCSFLYRRAKEEDRVFLFFAGCGGAEKDPLKIYEDRWRKYLLPYDCRYDEFFSSAMDIDELARYLKGLASKEIHFFIDCSFKGGRGSRSATSSPKAMEEAFDDSFVEPLLSGRGRNIYMAADPNDGAYESNSLEHGIFTHCLLEGLRGKAKREGQWITPEDLAEYLRLQVRSKARKEGLLQRAYLRGDPTRKFKICPVEQEKPLEIQVENSRFLDREKTFEISESPYSIGSSPSCDLTIEKAPPLHSVLVLENHRDWKIRSLSQKPLVINGKEVREKILFDRDEILIEEKTLVFLDKIFSSSLDRPDKLYSKEKVLAELQMSSEELEEMIADGDITPVEQNGETLFDPREVEELKLSRAVQPTLELGGTLAELRKGDLLSAQSSIKNTFSLRQKKESNFGSHWREKLASGETLEFLQPKGAITAQALDFLKDVLEKSGPLLIVDFTSVLWINPRGMELMEETAKKKLEDSHKMILCGIKERIEPHLLQIEALKNLPRFSTVEEAKDSLFG